MESVYGVARGKLFYEPAVKGLPEEQVWSTEKYLDFAPKLFDALREKHGFGVHLLHDVHHRLTPIEAARLGKSLEPHRLFWMEDPTPAENQRSEEHTSELQSLMRISYAVFCLNKTNNNHTQHRTTYKHHTHYDHPT